MNVYENVKEAISVIAINSLINSYTLETIILGKIFPGEKINLQQIITELNLPVYTKGSIDEKALEGVTISHDAKIKNKDMEYFYNEFFEYHFSFIFANANKYRRMELNEFFTELYLLFKDIAKTKACIGLTKNAVSYRQRNEIMKFLVSLKLKGLQIGKSVMRYFKNIEDVPKFLETIVVTKNNVIRIKNNDTQSIEYKLALLSCLPFLTNEHAALFFDKIQSWKSSHIY